MREREDVSVSVELADLTQESQHYSMHAAAQGTELASTNSAMKR